MLQLQLKKTNHWPDLSRRHAWMLLLLAGFACGATESLDSLRTPQIPPFIVGDAPQWTAAASRVTGPEVLGWEREVVLTKTSLPSDGTEEPLATSIGGGVVKVECGEDATYTLSLLWDGVGEPTPIGTNDLALNAELASPGTGISNLFFQFVADISVPQSARLTVRLWNETNRFSEFTTDYLEAGGPHFHSIPLSSCQANFDSGSPAQIKSIEVVLRTERAGTQAELRNIGFHWSELQDAAASSSAAVFVSSRQVRLTDGDFSWAETSVEGLLNPRHDLLVGGSVSLHQRP